MVNQKISSSRHFHLRHNWWLLLFKLWLAPGFYRLSKYPLVVWTHVTAQNVQRVYNMTRRRLLAQVTWMQTESIVSSTKPCGGSHSVLCHWCQSVNVERTTIPGDLNILCLGLYKAIIRFYLLHDPTSLFDTLDRQNIIAIALHRRLCGDNLLRNGVFGGFWWYVVCIKIQTLCINFELHLT